MRSLRVLSRLLAYPSAELLEQLPALKAVLIEDGFLKKKSLQNLSGFVDEMAKSDLMDTQELYVELFDRGRAHCCTCSNMFTASRGFVARRCSTFQNATLKKAW